MTSVVSMLRGVNVGGKRSIKMADLIDLYASIGLAKPQSYIQSGNVLFGTSKKNLTGLAGQIGDAIESRFGIRTDVILRTSQELAGVIDNNPFADRAEVLGKRLVVHFLAADPADDAKRRIQSLPPSPEELHLLGRELYVYYPDGVGRAAVTQSAIDRALGVPVTGRNWNTVLKLLELAVAHQNAR
jgi:uncharacterized protein (DUF1697 family)